MLSLDIKEEEYLASEKTALGNKYCGFLSSHRQENLLKSVLQKRMLFCIILCSNLCGSFVFLWLLRFFGFFSEPETRIVERCLFMHFSGKTKCLETICIAHPVLRNFQCGSISHGQSWLVQITFGKKQLLVFCEIPLKPD